MYTISDNEIELIRGDTLYAQVEIFQNGRPYIPKEGDEIRFAMKRRYNDPDDRVLIVKNIPTDTLLLKIAPEDTKELKFKRTYLWDIQLTTASGDVDTFITGRLKLKEEVY